MNSGLGYFATYSLTSIWSLPAFLVCYGENGGLNENRAFIRRFFQRETRGECDMAAALLGERNDRVTEKNIRGTLRDVSQVT